MSSPNTVDFLTPFDPTAYPSITGGQLEQLVGGLGPNTGIGFVVSTTDVGNVPSVPNATGLPKWANYIWLRISATAATPYIWNPNGPNNYDPVSGSNLLQWATIAAASIGVGTIVDSMIAPNTITADKIATVNYSSLVNAPTGLPPSGAAGGVLSGTYPNPTIVNAGITSAMFAAGAVTSAAVGTGASGITYANIAPNATGLSMLRTNTGATAVEWFVPPSIFTSAAVVTTANALKIPQVATAGAGDTGTWQMVNLPIQTRKCIVSSVTDNDGGLNHYVAGSLPTTSVGKHIAALDVTFTPKSNASTIQVEVILQLANPSTQGTAAMVASLFNSLNGTPTNAVAVATAETGGNYISRTVSLFYSFASTGAAITFSVYYGGTAGTTYLNGGTGYTFGAVYSSGITVTEFI